MKRLTKTAFFLGFMAIVLAPAEGRQKWAGSVKKDGDIIVVDNPSEPIYKENIMDLKLEFVIRGNGDGGLYSLNKIAWIVLDEKNRIYTLDYLTDEIFVFDDQGRYVRTIGRTGMGPGELDGLQGLCISAREVVAACPSTRRAVFFDLNGLYKRMLHPSFTITQIKSGDNGDIFVLTFSGGSEKELRYDLLRCDREFVPKVKIDSRKWEKPRFYGALMSFDLLPGGRIVIGNPAGYEFKIFDRTGKLLKIVIKKYKPIPIPTKDRNSVKEKDKIGAWELPYNFDPYYIVFSGDDGRIFVNTHYTITGKKENMFDVFDHEGRYLSKFRLKSCQHYLWRNGRLYTLGEDSEGYPLISVYKVTWAH